MEKNSARRIVSRLDSRKKRNVGEWALENLSCHIKAWKWTKLVSESSCIIAAEPRPAFGKNCYPWAQVKIEWKIKQVSEGKAESNFWSFWWLQALIMISMIKFGWLSTTVSRHKV